MSLKYNIDSHLSYLGSAITLVEKPSGYNMNKKEPGESAKFLFIVVAAVVGNDDKSNS